MSDPDLLSERTGPSGAQNTQVYHFERGRTPTYSREDEREERNGKKRKK